ncbi:unnamed protein product [Candidula unifasciata]|uniref:G-protein coupled receptors family 1 profile domain-containing protein n=1 Tax=Candidula unifasciata TaxID=100452 RepID=A0A8S3Z5E0_9EUPU|nr:unnamed protein product [Candidula unifasciata]
MFFVNINDTLSISNRQMIHYQRPLINDRERDIYMVANYVLVTAAISLFGVVANIINIRVFFKQGFSSTVNITFFAIAISDLGSLLGLLWGGVCVNPLFVYSDAVIVPLEILYLTSGIPHICFVRITGWLTVFITAERCLCIISPLKIKQLITPKVTMATVSSIYIAIMLSFVPEFEIAYFDWKFYPHKNRTLLGLMFTSKKSSNEGIVFFLYSVLGTVSFVAVIIFTIILVQQLKQKSKWRKKANIERGLSESMSSRDRKTMNMVVLIAIVLIVCYIPGVAVSLTTFSMVEFRIFGREVNLFYVAWTFAFIFEAINASINIFVYYKMSSKYRETFCDMFRITASYK